MQSAEPHPTSQLMSEVAQGRIQDILKEVPRAKVTPEAGEGGQVTLNVEVAGRPIFREFVLAGLDVPDSKFVPSLLELRHIAIHCPSWTCEAGALEDRTANLRRSALEENNVRPITIHAFRYGRNGHEEQVL